MLDSVPSLGGIICEALRARFPSAIVHTIEFDKGTCVMVNASCQVEIMAGGKYGEFLVYNTCPEGPRRGIALNAADPNCFGIMNDMILNNLIYRENLEKSNASR